MIPSHGGSLPSLHMPPHKGDSGKQKSRHPKDDGATAEDGGTYSHYAITQVTTTFLQNRYFVGSIQVLKELRDLPEEQNQMFHSCVKVSFRLKEETFTQE